MGIQGKKIAFHTLGCKVNAYETEAMEQAVIQAGAEVVPFSGPADIYVVNTCSVTNMADRKSRQMLHRAKKENPDSLVLACGCYAEVEEAEKLYDTGVDLILGNNEKSRIAEILNAYLETGEKNVKPDINSENLFENMGLTAVREHTRAYLKVQDGCNQFCSYCIIPYARGRVRSHKLSEVLREVQALSESGVKEIVLTGIHICSYGTDFADTEEDMGPMPLLQLIRACAEVPGIERIRLGSLEPRIVTEEFAEGLSKIEKICPHFHLSLQSGSQTVLKRMNRHYSPEEYEEGCRILRKYFDDPALTTDVIVGFPGETEEEFEESRAFAEKIGFYEMHVFQYSRRKGTKADRMPGQIPEDIKKKRSSIMISLGEKMSENYRTRWLSKEAEVLTEEGMRLEGTNYMSGYTREYVRVALPEETPENTIVKGLLTEKLSREVLYMKP